MRKKKSGCIRIILVIIAIIIALVVAVFFILNRVKKADYYSLGKDQVPAIKLVVGERKVSGVYFSSSNGVTTKTYKYSSDSSHEDVEHYLTYLSEKAGYLTVGSETGEIIYYGIDSVDEGKIILIKVDEDPFGYTVEIHKGEGVLTPLS